MDCKHISHIKDVIMHGKNLLLPHRKENIGMSELDENAGKSTASDKITQDLMRLVGAAIDEWANLYGMNNLPKKIIFQQALTILNAMNTLLFK